MGEIKIEHAPDKQVLEEKGVYDWPIWTHEEAVFPWTYDETETCFFLEGEVVVTPDRGEPVRMGRGDLVVFPKGVSCRWEIKKGVRKHYSFG